MNEIVWEAPERSLNAMGSSRDDEIGCRRFLEVMISNEITGIQKQYYALNGSKMSLEKLFSGLITRLLEIMHGE